MCLCPKIAPASSANRKLSPLGVNSGVSWFCDSVRFRALWCCSLARNPLILLEGALACASVRLGCSD
jgi:hypothetical protein